MSKTCTSCGKDLADEMNFCPACATAVAETVSMQQLQYAQQPTQLQRTKPSKVPGRGFGITSMILGIIGLILSVPLISIYFDITIRWPSNAALYNETFVEAVAYLSAGAALMFAFLCVLAVCFLFGILALCFGCIARRKGYRCNISHSGLLMGVIVLAVCVLGIMAIVFL